MSVGLPAGPVIASIHQLRDEFRQELQEAAGRQIIHSIRSKTCAGSQAPPAASAARKCGLRRKASGSVVSTNAARQASASGTPTPSLIQRNIHHGGVLVHCEDRAVEIRTVLHTQLKAMGKGWLTVQKRYWHDDNCSDPILAGAIAHGWSLKAVILVGAHEAASFTVSCGGQ